MYPAYKLKIVLNSGIKIGNFFKFKDSLPYYLRSLVVYQFTCVDCNVVYIGKTKRHFKIRACEHLGIGCKTGKTHKYNASNATVVRQHLYNTKHTSDIKSFKILSSAKNDFQLLLKESLLIASLTPQLNKQVKSYQLELF